MELNILVLCYLIGSVSFILGLKMLSNPATARKGNLIAAAGMIMLLQVPFFCINMMSKVSKNIWVTLHGFLPDSFWVPSPER